MWGATRVAQQMTKELGFNSRTPCGVRRLQKMSPAMWGVSIHAPRVGCDQINQTKKIIQLCFNSRTPCGVRQRAFYSGELAEWFQFTHPVWGATIAKQRADADTEVSIHAPRVGCDCLAKWVEQIKHKFQFTHPVWGATVGRCGRR